MRWNGYDRARRRIGVALIAWAQCLLVYTWASKHSWGLAAFVQNAEHRYWCSTQSICEWNESVSTVPDDSFSWLQ